MGNLGLDKDEVLLLQQPNVWYSGSYGEYTFEQIILTNKKILCTGHKRRNELKFEIPLVEIKMYNGNPLVGSYNDSTNGQCLQIQTINGVEVFKIVDEEDYSIKKTFQTFFSGKKEISKKLKTWIDTIKREINNINNSIQKQSDNDNNNEIKKSTESTQTDENNSKTINKCKESEEEFIVCNECGNKYSINSRFCPSCGTPRVKPKAKETEKIIEVIKCRKCGAKINDSNRFCPECGTPVIETEKTPETQKVDTNKKNVSKCPICGEFLPSDVLKCPSCGNEIRGREAASSLIDFSREITLLDDEKKKIEMIKLFPIPNNKEDITEFMYIATTNFDPKEYANQEDSVARAWLIKMEQCYKKASIMFDPKEMETIEKIYTETKQKIKKQINVKLLLILSGVILTAISIILIIAAVATTPQTAPGEETKTSPLATPAFIVHFVGVGLLVFGLILKKKNKK